jgi:D-hydroxyproline dehydrogenase subunit gamma
MKGGGPSAACAISVDGRRLTAVEGQSLAALLVAHGIWHFRRNPVSAEPRGPFCGMGVCFECELEVDGRPGVRSCLTPVSDGMRVRTAFG